MSRVFVYRLVISLVALAVFGLLTSIVYEIVVAARWNPALPGEGKNRWALLQLQNSRRDFGSLLIAWDHFWQRVRFPGTQLETIIRATIAAGVTLGVGATLAILSVVMRKPTHHGNARFGNLLDAERKNLLAKGGLLLGRLNGATIASDDPSHVLVVGPTRSGKGVSFVIPNGYMWRGSSVWFDPKREIFEAIGAHRQELGDKVFMFSPGERDTHRYNPLDFIRRDARMPTDAAVVASFIIPEGQGSSEIWGRTGRQLLTALIGYVVSSDRCEGKRHLRSVANLTSTGIEFLKVLTNIRDREGNQLPGWVVQSFNQFIALEKETRNSAFFNVTAAMSPWTNDLIAASTSTTDFDIARLRREPMAIFIGCSIAQLDVFRPIIKMLIQQIHDVLMTSMPGPDEPHQVLVMIDEFRQLGKMESIVSKLTINAGYGFRMVLVLQDLAQLDELYGKATRQTTVSACQVKLFIRMNDLETSEYVSEMLGSTTTEIRTPIIRGGQGIFATRDKSVSYQERALRTAEELRQLPSDRAIVLVPNAPGFMIRKITYYSEAPFKAIYRRFLGRYLKVPRLPAWSLDDGDADNAAGEVSGLGPAPATFINLEEPYVRHQVELRSEDPADVPEINNLVGDCRDEEGPESRNDRRPGEGYRSGPKESARPSARLGEAPAPAAVPNEGLATRRVLALDIPQQMRSQELTISSLMEANATKIADDEAVLVRATTLAEMSDEARTGIDLTALRMRRYADRRAPPPYLAGASG
jgi:type IV secretion system protein VirD4